MPGNRHSYRDLLTTQIEWFKRQLFGTMSEKQRLIDPVVQGNLLARLGVTPALVPCAIPIEAVTYQRKKLRETSITDTGLRFDATVLVHEITIGDSAIERLSESAREVIGEKVTYRLAQRPTGYEVIKYNQRVYRLRESGEVRATVTPPAVLEKCVVDVSLLAGMLIDKFQYHLPLYHQHQRLEAAGLAAAHMSAELPSSKVPTIRDPFTSANSWRRQWCVTSVDYQCNRISANFGHRVTIISK